MDKMYFIGLGRGIRCVGDNSSHLLFNVANLNYHHLHNTYTTGVYAIYHTCTFRVHHISDVHNVSLDSERCRTKIQFGDM